MDRNFGTFFSFTLKLLKQSQMHLQKQQFISKLKAKRTLKECRIFFRSGFLAYILAASDSF